MNFVDLQTDYEILLENEKGSDETERKLARAATVCLQQVALYKLHLILFPFKAKK